MSMSPLDQFVLPMEAFVFPSESIWTTYGPQVTLCPPSKPQLTEPINPSLPLLDQQGPKFCLDGNLIKPRVHELVHTGHGGLT